jgi:Kef-type K+ transport system membrane component KefB
MSTAHQSVIHLPVILGVVLVLSVALLGRLGARRFALPTVLVELLLGILVGNLLYHWGYDLMLILREGASCSEIVKLVLAGKTWNEAATVVVGAPAAGELVGMLRGEEGGLYLQVSQALDLFTNYGVMFVLFHVGLRTHVAELRNMGRQPVYVAIIGAFAPMLLGFLVVWLLDPATSQAGHIFVASTLGATGAAVTTRVLGKQNRLQSAEARIIIGAATIDDVIALVMLAIASGIAMTGSAAADDIGRTVLHASLFIICAFGLGPGFLRLLAWMMHRFDVVEAKLFVSFILAMVLIILANIISLSPVVGAFAAGLLMHESYFLPRVGEPGEGRYSIRELLAPLEVIIVPAFFVLMGIQVKLEVFLDWHTLYLTAGVVAAAALGKWISGLGVGEGANRLTVGFGMTPRGEVGLAFAFVGKALGIIDATMFAVIVLMVVITTLVTPLLLRLSQPDGGGQQLRKGGA